MQDHKNAEHIIIGDWQLDCSNSQLCSDEHTVPLKPKVLAALTLLCAHANTIVTHDMLMAHLWPKQIVSDSSLYQVIAQLRKALGDTTDPRRYIERISKQGYRLVAPVQYVEATTASLLVPDTRRRFPYGIAIASASIILAATLFLILKPSTETTEATATPSQRLALITFDSAQRHHQAIVKGFSDTLTTQINTTDGLTVIRLPAQDASQRDIREQLRQQFNVDGLLNGQLQIQGESIRATLQYFSGPQLEMTWSQVFDGQRSALFQLQDQMTHAVQHYLNKVRRVSQAATPLSESEGFDDYLVGRFLWNRHQHDDLNKAEQRFKHAIEKDPQFSLAYVGLCDTYYYQSIYQKRTPDDAHQQCQPLLSQALTLTPQLGQALASQGLLLTQQRQHTQAETLFKQAIKAAPNYAPSYFWYGLLLRQTGQITASIEKLQHAITLSPYSALYHRHLALTLLNDGAFARAFDIYHRALEIEPHYLYQPLDQLNFLPLTVDTGRALLQWVEQHPDLLQRQTGGQVTVALSFLALARTEDAIKLIQRAAEQTPNHPFVLLGQGILANYQNKPAEALRLFEKRFNNAPAQPHFAIPLVAAHVKRGDQATAKALLRKTYPNLFSTTPITIDRKNHTQYLFLWQLLQLVGETDAQQRLEQPLTAYMARAFNPHRFAHIRWQALTGDPDTAFQHLEALLRSGWIPDFSESLWPLDQDPLWHRWNTEQHHTVQALITANQQAINP